MCHKYARKKVIIAFYYISSSRVEGMLNRSVEVGGIVEEGDINVYPTTGGSVV
jgi:hypothetical protein